jgi:spore coat protein U-like protein
MNSKTERRASIAGSALASQPDSWHWQTLRRTRGGVSIRSVTIVALLVMLAAGAERSATAATSTGSLTVSASVAGACAIGSTTAMAFGQYNPLSASNLTMTATMTIRCVKSTSYRTYIAGTRTMAGGSDPLPFDICLTQNYTSDGQCVTSYPSTYAAASSQIAANKNPVSISLYGIIPAGADVGSGNYSAPLVSTIEW